MNHHQPPQSDPLAHRFGQLARSEASDADFGTIDLCDIQRRVAAKTQSRKRRRLVASSLCLLAAVFAIQWPTGPLASRPARSPGLGADHPPRIHDTNSQDLMEHALASRDLQRRQLPTAAEPPPTATPTEQPPKVAEQRVAELMRQLDEIQLNTERIAAEISLGMMEQHIHDYQRQLLKSIRLRARSDYLLGMNQPRP